MCLYPPACIDLLSALPPSLAAAAKEESDSHGPRAIAVSDHLHWARTIARGVRRSFRFMPNSQEEADLEATAFLAIVELAKRFDFTKVPPGGDPAFAFRGWIAIEVRCRCRREARRLRKGGTYCTRREKAGRALVVEPLRNESQLIDPHSTLEQGEMGEECES